MPRSHSRTGTLGIRGWQAQGSTLGGAKSLPVWTALLPLTPPRLEGPWAADLALHPNTPSSRAGVSLLTIWVGTSSISASHHLGLLSSSLGGPPGRPASPTPPLQSCPVTSPSFVSVLVLCPLKLILRVHSLSPLLNRQLHGNKAFCLPCFPE